MEPTNLKRDRTRSSSSGVRDLIGSSKEDISPLHLPSEKCVLQVIAYYKELPKNHFKGPQSFCCPANVNGEKRAQCCLPGGCLERDDPCLLAKVTLPYRTAGIATISDWSIVNRLVSLNDAFGKIYCLRDRQTPSHISLKEKFIQQINRTWNIADPNAKNAIMNDPNRDKAAKKEDLAFLKTTLDPTRQENPLFLVQIQIL